MRKMSEIGKRKCVDWSVHSHVQLLQVCRSLEVAVDANQPETGQKQHCLIHSDTLLLDGTAFIRCFNENEIGHENQSKSASFDCVCVFQEVHCPRRWWKCLTAVISSHLAHIRMLFGRSASMISRVTGAGRFASCSPMQMVVARARIMPMCVVAEKSSSKRWRAFSNLLKLKGRGLSRNLTIIESDNASSKLDALSPKHRCSSAGDPIRPAAIEADSIAAGVRV
jgi:hypothetical protein